MIPSDSDHPRNPERADELMPIDRLDDLESGPIAERLRNAAVDWDLTARAIVASRPLGRTPWLDGIAAGEMPEARTSSPTSRAEGNATRDPASRSIPSTSTSTSIASGRPRRGSWLGLAVAATVALIGAISFAFEWGRSVGAGAVRERLAARASAATDEFEPILTAAWRPIADGVPSEAGERYLTALGAPIDCRVDDRSERANATIGRSFDCCTRCHRSGSDAISIETRPERILRNCAVCHVAAPPPACERTAIDRQSGADERAVEPSLPHGASGRCGDCHVAGDLAPPNQMPSSRTPRSVHDQGRACKECHIATSARPRRTLFEMRSGEALLLASVLR